MIDPETLVHDRLTEVRALVSEYSFRLSELPHVKIRVKIWRTDVSSVGIATHMPSVTRFTRLSR